MDNSIKIPSMEHVTPFAEIQKLTIKEAVEHVVAGVKVGNRMFAIIAKLILHLAVTVKAPDTVGGLLRKAGVRKTTIDNGRQHARVFEELVLQKHITEAQFNELTFAECIAINRSMSGGAKEKQSGKAVAALMKAKPKTFDDELVSLATYGHSVAVQAKIEKEAKIEAEKAAKVAADTAATTADTGSTSTDTGTTSAGTTPAPKPAATTPAAGKTPAQKVDAAHILTLIAALESAYNTSGITPIEAAKTLPALTELHTHVKALVGTIIAPRPRGEKIAARKVVKLPAPVKQDRKVA